MTPRIRRSPDGRHAFCPTGRNEDWYEYQPGAAWCPSIWRHLEPDREQGPPSVLDGWTELALVEPGEPLPDRDALRDRIARALADSSESRLRWAEAYEADRDMMRRRADAVLPVVEQALAEQDERATDELDSHLAVLREERDGEHRERVAAVDRAARAEIYAERAEYQVRLVARDRDEWQRRAEKAERERDEVRQRWINFRTAGNNAGERQRLRQRAERAERERDEWRRRAETERDRVEPERQAPTRAEMLRKVSHAEDCPGPERCDCPTGNDLDHWRRLGWVRVADEPADPAPPADELPELTDEEPIRLADTHGIAAGVLGGRTPREYLMAADGYVPVEELTRLAEDFEDEAENGCGAHRQGMRVAAEKVRRALAAHEQPADPEPPRLTGRQVELLRAAKKAGIAWPPLDYQDRREVQELTREGLLTVMRGLYVPTSRGHLVLHRADERSE